MVSLTKQIQAAAYERNLPAGIQGQRVGKCNPSVTGGENMKIYNDNDNIHAQQHML